MGKQLGIPYETTERFRGNRRSTGNSTVHLEVMVDTLPHCGYEAPLLCLPKGKFKADMPPQGLGSVQLPAWDQLGSENERPRSRSIPIKIKTAVADDSAGSIDDTCQCDMCRYELATWRMYNRMVAHRMKYPVNFCQNVAPRVSRQASDIATLHSRYHSSDNGKLSSFEMVDTMPVDDSNDYLEREVFELEL
jgi:hypothetical protein